MLLLLLFLLGIIYYDVSNSISCTFPVAEKLIFNYAAMIFYELCKKKVRRKVVKGVSGLLVSSFYFGPKIVHRNEELNITCLCLTLSPAHLLISYITHQSIDLPYI